MLYTLSYFLYIVKTLMTRLTTCALMTWVVSTFIIFLHKYIITVLDVEHRVCIWCNFFSYFSSSFIVFVIVKLMEMYAIWLLALWTPDECAHRFLAGRIQVAADFQHVCWTRTLSHPLVAPLLNPCSPDRPSAPKNISSTTPTKSWHLECVTVCMLLYLLRFVCLCMFKKFKKREREREREREQSKRVRETGSMAPPLRDPRDQWGPAAACVPALT